MSLFSRCGKDEPDRTKPFIAGFSSSSGNTVSSDLDLNLVYSVSDETGLAQLKFQITNIDQTVETDTAVSKYWNLTDIKDVNGTSATGSVSFSFPINVAAGNYIIVLTAVDKSGNTSLPDTLNLVFLNSSDVVSPVVMITNPAEGAVISSGSTVVADVNLSDNEALSRFELQVVSGGNTILNVAEIASASTLNLNYNLNAENWLPGNYTLEVRAFDRVMNKTSSIRNFVKQ